MSNIEKCDKIVFENFINTIIANARKELSMIDKQKWEVPLYSKNQINKAGKIFVSSNSTQEEKEQALTIINNWRASHAYPLQVICSNLRRSYPNAIVVQRLKRLESITGKIERFPEMQLYKMQDLGGCRVIVDSIDQVYLTAEKYKKSHIRHIHKRDYDYIENPKKSGYRSYHAIYQFHSDAKETYNKNMLIEIQFRTKLQHIWATAVETMGIYTKSNLKSSQGDENILRFFVLVSSLFAIEERCPTCPNTSSTIDELVAEIKDLNNKHKITSTLSGLKVAINYTQKKNNQKKNTYYVLILDYQKRMMSIKDFNAADIAEATCIYNKIEEKTSNDNINVVLVSADSFNNLRAAYPNYFVDISQFIEKVDKYIN